MRFLAWAVVGVAGLWYGQERGWIAGSHWHSVVLVTAVYAAYPFARGYYKIYRASRAARALKNTSVKG